MKSILVTGGAGFIGSNYVRYVLKTAPDVRVVNLDALTYAGSPANVRDLTSPERHTFVHGDIRDPELVASLLRQYEVDAIVHFAAESHVDRSILGPSPFVHTNVVGTFTLLDAAREVWATKPGGSSPRQRFHHISTDEVYGSLGPEDPPFTEVHHYAPNSPYAASKAASDHLVRAYGQTYGMPILVTNCSNNYGPYQFPEKLIPLVILSAREGKVLPVYGDGQQVRDWLFVEDHCEALWKVLQSGRVGETYHIGGNNQVTNLAVVRQICAILDQLVPESSHRPHESRIRLVGDRPGHDRRYAMDTTKIELELGWRPQHSLEQGLQQTVEWYLAHSDWLSAINERSGFQAWLAGNYGSRNPTAT